MRVTGNRLIDQSSAATTRSQTEVGTASQQASTGMRVDKPSDDPSAWLAARRANLKKALTEGASAAVQASRERLDETDGALAAIGDAVSQVRALAVQGSSDSYNATTRAELGLQVRALFQTALAAANTKSADGEYLFAGSASLTEPFDATGTYVGDSTTRAVPTFEGGTTAATVAGSDLTAAAGVDVLAVLDRVATALANNDTTALSAGLGELDTAVKQVSRMRTRSGVEMSVLDDTATAQGALADNLTKTIARHVEADAIGAATALAKATQALEVSRAVTSHIVSLLGSRSA
jgi:flagellar hook-associated protein 3 FlgL